MDEVNHVRRWPQIYVEDRFEPDTSLGASFRLGGSMSWQPLLPVRFRQTDEVIADPPDEVAAEDALHAEASFGDTPARANAGASAADLPGLPQTADRLDRLPEELTREVANPYRGLDVHDVGHRLYGRSDECGRAIDAISAAFAHSINKLPIVQLHGVSGSGKSSLLRAGILTILGGMQAPSPRYLCMVSRFSASTWTESAPADLIAEFLSDLFRDTKGAVTFDPPDFLQVKTAGNAAGRTAANILAAKLAKLGATTRLVIGIDQFEELVDGLVQRNPPAGLQAFVDFLNDAVATSPTGIVYTLESTRMRAFGDLCESGVLGESFRLPHISTIRVEGGELSFIREVIKKPFSDAGYALAQPVVDVLEENYCKLRDKIDAKSSGGLLPLVSLRLAKLFDHVQTILEPRLPASNLSLDADWEGRTNDTGRVTLDIIGNDLDFGSVIDDLASIAWQRAKNSSQVDKMNLDYFLQPLVSVTDAEQVQLLDIPMPDYLDERKLVERFRDVRLLTRSKDTPNARYKLVHEAVLRHWRPAAEWLTEASDYLKVERNMRLEAAAWVDRGKPALVMDDFTETDIDNAAMVLGSNFRLWGDPKFRDIHGGALCDYCMVVFQFSLSPDQVVKNPLQNDLVERRSTAALAALYGMKSLLARYFSRYPGCLGGRQGEDQRSLLHRAAWYHPTTVEYLLGNGVDPLAETTSGWLPIAGAIQAGRFDCFQMLLQRMPRPAYANAKEHITVAYLAAHFGRLAMLESAIEHDGPEAATICTDFGMLPIHAAALGGATDVMRLLALRYTELSATTRDGSTCLHLASVHNRVDVVRSLLQDRNAANSVGATRDGGATALWDAAYQKHLLIVEMLLKHIDPTQAYVDVESGVIQHAIHAALQKLPEMIRDEERIYAVVEILLNDPRTDVNAVNADGKTPLEMAEGLPRIQARLFAHPKIDPLRPGKEGGTTPLMMAAKAGQWRAAGHMLRDCRRKGCDKLDELRDTDENTLLHLATSPMAVDVLGTVLDQCSPEAGSRTNKFGSTPSYEAVKAGNVNALRAIVAKFGPSTLGQPKDGSSIVDVALRAPNREQLLDIIAAANPKTFLEKSRLGWTVLHSACASQDRALIDLLRRAVPDSHEAWTIEDDFGRKPVDVLQPTARKSIRGARPNTVWPTPCDWSTGLEWTSLDEFERAGLLSEITPIDDSLKVGDDCAVEKTNLGFHETPISLIRIKDSAWSQANLAIYYIKSYDGKAVRLHGTSLPIHEFNKQYDLRLTKDNVLRYLRFFCFFVRGADGPFYVHEDARHLYVPGIEDVKRRAEVRDLARPTWLCRVAPDESEFFCSAAIWYSDRLFSASLCVRDSGMVEMLDDLPIGERLNARIDAPI